ncbi:pre-mRNA-splicing factor rse1 [Mycoemilia scoparia]|uniref:Pre-mRNA-splicing factor rse1 n=1 Tax=Mycoemilia scoparia TaxID=417184 RepID=A0A9W8DRH1_9FUNG|nr:pre-mRNA-splicing factor rse1 [Mycoemilia scoparia]
MTSSEVFLYNLTLQPYTVINAAVLGHFTGKPKCQEIAISRHTVLELWTINPNTQKLKQLCSQEVFGKIRTIIPFRLTGGTKDHLIIGTDAGTITVLDYNVQTNRFEVSQQQEFGRTGLRRFIPGQYLATDPKGRSAMIAGVEKQKFVYIFNRDSNTNLVMSSPLEAHKGASFCFDCVGVDVGYENPVFATIEQSYPTDMDSIEIEDKLLVFYELDLGLNHVVRKWTDPVHPTANKLISIPGGGGSDGPGGVLVCAEGLITYKNEGHDDLTVAIPRRVNPLENSARSSTVDRGLLIVASAVHRMKNAFFILLQNEDGDLYKVTIEHVDGVITELKIKYFDTIPTSASLCILRSGFLFSASEFGHHNFYQFENLGDETETQEYTSKNYEDENITYFQPHELSCLALIDVIESTNPIIESKVLNLAEEETPQIYSLCGRGAQSALKILRHGLEVSELAASELPGNPRAVWTVKGNSPSSSSQEENTYIVVSFLDATLVLLVGGEEVEEVTDSGLITDTPTICVHELGDDSIVQIMASSVRHIKRDGRINEWKPPQNREIVAACANRMQIVVALNRGELIYFELDPSVDALREWGERARTGSEVSSLAIMDVPVGRLRAPFVAVGGQDQTVRILSLQPESCLQPQGMQALTDLPESLVLVEMGSAISNTSKHGSGATDDDSDEVGDNSSATTLYLYIGLHNGLLQRSIVDNITGVLSDTRTRFLGTKPVKLFQTTVHNQQQKGVLALSSRPWLSHMFRSRNRLIPLSYDYLDYAASFSSDQCPEGLVAISENTLRVLTIDNVDVSLNQASIPLRHTPRRIALNEDTKNFVIIETDHATFSQHDLKEKLIKDVGVSEEDAEQCILPPEQFGHVRAQSGQWASCIRVLNPFTGESTQIIDLEENEAAFSLDIITLSTPYSEDVENQESEENNAANGHSGNEKAMDVDGQDKIASYVVVGTGRNVTLKPRTCTEAYIHIYRWVKAQKAEPSADEEAEEESSSEVYELELVHKTQIEQIPQAIVSFNGHLMVGFGQTIRVYQMGRKKLLRKAQAQIPEVTQIVSLKISSSSGDRIMISDVKGSVFYATYRPASTTQKIHVFADDPIPRHITSSVQLDNDTIAVGDKFGNFSILRLPELVSKELANDITGNRVLHAKPKLNGTAFKLQDSVNFHVGDIITSMHKVSLAASGRDVILFTTLLGSIQVAIPFVSKTDVEFFQTLEMHLRGIENISVCGRDHQAFRSIYGPIKRCVDGNLCEQFLSLPYEQQSNIAAELDRSIPEVHKKIEDMRTMFAF